MQNSTWQGRAVCQYARLWASGRSGQSWGVCLLTADEPAVQLAVAVDEAGGYFINTGRIRFSNVKISSHFSWVNNPRSVTAMSCTDLPVFKASLAISAEAS